ncbi:MAG: hypothetical protein IJ247_06145 [Bacilli bacterium]|nr:hypothetical protein [Bacilli bacterium]
MNKTKSVLLVSSLLFLLSACNLVGHRHNFVYVSALRPTLDTVGYSKGFYHCKACNKYYLNENDEEEVNINDYLIEKKSEKVEIEKGNYSDISYVRATASYIDQVDWKQYTYGVGDASYQFYNIDDKNALRVSTEQMDEFQKMLRNNDGEGYSIINFSKNVDTRYVTFDYKYYDLNDELDSSKRHVRFDYNDKTKTVNLIGDNKWHSVSIDLEMVESLEDVSLSIYRFDGELYIADMLLSREVDVDASNAYEINNITEGNFKATFGLDNNVLAQGEYQIKQEGEYKKSVYLLRKELKYYIGDQVTLNKINENKYELMYNDIQEGDIITMDSSFIGTFNGIEYHLNNLKVTFFFFRVGAEYYHYVNRNTDVISFMEISNKSDLSIEAPGKNIDDSYYYPTSSNNILIDGMYLANSALIGLKITNRNTLNILFDEQEISSFIRTNSIVSLSGFFQNKDDNLHGIYIYKYTFQYDGYEWKIVDNDTPITPYKELDGLNIGFWNGNCHFQSDASLETIAKLGVDVIVGVNPIWHNNFSHVLDKALSLGIKFIVDPRGWDSVNGVYLPWDGTCPSYANHEAVLGFFMYDEPQTPKYPDLKAMKALYDQVMPQDKLFFINMFPSACGLSGLYGDDYDATAEDYEEYYVNPYIEQINPPAYAWDTYPLFNDGTVRKAYYCDFDVWSHKGKENNAPLWYSLLTCSHGSGDGGKAYIMPTHNELRWQISVGLSYGVKNYLHYIYASNSSDYDVIADPNGNIVNQNLYDDTQVVDYEMRYLSTIYSSYNYEGTAIVDIDEENMMFQNLKHSVSYSSTLQEINSSEDLLIGLFSKEEGEALMITNAGSAPSTSYKSITSYNFNLPFYMNDAEISLKTKKNHSGAYIYNRGMRRYISMNGSNSLSMTINSFDSAFIVFID